METKNVFCPHCQSQLDTPVSLEGKEVQCPICKKNFTVTFQPESENNDQPDINPPQEYKAQQFSQHSAQSDPSASLSKKENPVRIAKNEKASRPIVSGEFMYPELAGCFRHCYGRFLAEPYTGCLVAFGFICYQACWISQRKLWNRQFVNKLRSFRP